METQTTKQSIATLCAGMKPPQIAELQKIGKAPARWEEGLPSTEEEKPEEEEDRLNPTLLTAMSFYEAEAALSLELDRINGLPDPMEKLSDILDVMQGINLELLKSMAPVLMENARIKADTFAEKGKLTEDGREEHRTFNAFTRLQETITKIGVAKARVEDEKNK